MSQQQQSEEPPQQPQQPNWLVGLVVAAIVSGIVQVLVNHYDAIAAAIVGLFSQVHLPPLQETPIFVALNIVSGILIIFLSVLVGIRSMLTTLERQRHRERHQRLIAEQQRRIAEQQILIAKRQWEVTEQLVKQQRNEGSSTLE